MPLRELAVSSLWPSSMPLLGLCMLHRFAEACHYLWSSFTQVFLVARQDSLTRLLILYRMSCVGLQMVLSVSVIIYPRSVPCMWIFSCGAAIRLSSYFALSWLSRATNGCQCEYYISKICPMHVDLSSGAAVRLSSCFALSWLSKATAQIRGAATTRENIK